ncbi:hypothetical protein ACFXD5_22540 [Streptomyces sp. NPDC059385]|uniref:hypothetical protein n=1 Tax=Streptomyces sp. NPDC059385 TaxID=3346817 RepID=UPI0036A5DBA5
MKDPFGCDAPALLECFGTADRAAARRAVAARAVDARDLALLLDILGLLPDAGPVSPRPPEWKADPHGVLRPRAE